MGLRGDFRVELSLRFQQLETHFLFPAEQGFFQMEQGIIRSGTGNLAARSGKAAGSAANGRSPDAETGKTFCEKFEPGRRIVPQ
jgi:hypothetical protein